MNNEIDNKPNKKLYTMPVEADTTNAEPNR